MNEMNECEHSDCHEPTVAQGLCEFHLNQKKHDEHNELMQREREIEGQDTRPSDFA